jgi:uncharacterized protein YjbI with pentapeptide repeats
LSNSFFVESGTDTGVIFKSCTFTGANFSGAQIFKNAFLNDEIFKNDENFKNVDFTGANFLKATLNSVRFESCILTGVNFTEANLYTKIIKSSSNTEDYEYTYTSFVNIDKFNNALFKKAKLYGVAFENCNLTKADFSEAQLTVISDEDEEYAEEYTIFNNVNLKEANFTSADLYSVSFIKNVNLRNANFTKAILTDAYLGYFDVFLEDTLFVGATITNVNFFYANYFGDPEDIDYEYKDPEDIVYDDDDSKIFSGLNFSSATLEDVNLSDSNFENVNFSNARLLNVNLAYSDLAYSNFSKAIIESDNGSTNLNYTGNLEYTIFKNADLSGAKIINEYNDGILFDGADLDNAEFTDCFFGFFSFDGAILENAEFTDCLFDNFSFDGATLDNAEFTNCSLSYFSFDDDTKFGVNSGGVDTRTTFNDCIIKISEDDVVLFFFSVSISIYSSINGVYVSYLLSLQN